MPVDIYQFKHGGDGVCIFYGGDDYEWLSDRGSYSYVDGCLYDSDRELIPTRPLDESVIEHNVDDTIWIT